MRTRISLRTVLWLVVIVAILAAWMSDRHRLEQRNRRLTVELAQSMKRQRYAEAKARSAMAFAKAAVSQNNPPATQ